MFKLKPIITRREEKLIIKYLKAIDRLQKEYKMERRKRSKDEPLGFSNLTYEISKNIGDRVETLIELLKTIYLDK